MNRFARTKQARNRRAVLRCAKLATDFPPNQCREKVLSGHQRLDYKRQKCSDTKLISGMAQKEERGEVFRPLGVDAISLERWAMPTGPFQQPDGCGRASLLVVPTPCDNQVPNLRAFGNHVRLGRMSLYY
jgi:hypothetical protein